MGGRVAGERTVIVLHLGEFPITRGPYALSDRSVFAVPSRLLAAAQRKARCEKTVCTCRKIYSADRGSGYGTRTSFGSELRSFVRDLFVKLLKCHRRLHRPAGSFTQGERAHHILSTDHFVRRRLHECSTRWGTGSITTCCG